MRPGKPALFATHESGCAIFGLPGNPVAALVAARFFIGRSLRAWFGLGDEPALCCLDEAPEPGPTRVLKARYPVHAGPRGIEVLPGQQSHILRPLLQANAWLVRGGGEPARVYALYDAGLT
jgi:molybdopterin molybdotransferase